ncbi:MBL fold metallo-hydrolase RNA specificity domain-containing protein [Imhoffiella purpurea]|uniref:Metallo-beta-lactamase family protein, RNA-specific n=1 Tax=Imhoffiella purpurea TaxID=1249627 RepID=W9W022_9GAMM|nr:MBL fold metallo-hydrolase [Imhoffiella purpurea]EXJ15970.1 Metallo-beta-lactamase family protein, RNA-specific [Imhoffiella purpurea]
MMGRHQPEILHHGAVDGVTGSCHELRLGDGRSVLVDCGLFQGAERSGSGAGVERLQFIQPVDHIQALIVTHVHIDHVGRIPYLLAAGFRGPIVCSEASAELLPMVIADALKVGVTRDARLIQGVIHLLRERTVAIPYGQWHRVLEGETGLSIRLQPAGHILGSAYVECDLRTPDDRFRILFSGDLGAPWTPLLPSPKSPYRADCVVLESTYGDRLHESRRDRHERLRAIVEHAFENGGTLLIPAFSIGRTQELLYELEAIIHANPRRPLADGRVWGEVEVILDSPLAADFTAGYRRLRDHWDREAKRRLRAGRHPLDFEQLLTIEDHDTHLRTVEYLARTGRAAILIAASGMCAGGRILNYLKAMLGDPRHDVLFVGYQAAGTPGRIIQRYGPGGGYVDLDGRRYDIRCGVHTLSGYSAHADQKDLVNFIRRMRIGPRRILLVHGEEHAKIALRDALTEAVPGAEVMLAGSVSRITP